MIIALFEPTLLIKDIVNNIFTNSYETNLHFFDEYNKLISIDYYDYVIIGPNFDSSQSLDYLAKSKIIFLTIESAPASLLKILVQCPYGIIHLDDILSLRQLFNLSAIKQTYISCRIEKLLGNSPSKELISLTKAEKEILLLIVRGFSNKEIANYRHISISTAETHRKHIKEKLGVKGGKLNIYKAIHPYIGWLTNTVYIYDIK